MNKIALCIGNDDYSLLQQLSCCVADATAVAGELEKLGFTTILQTNLDCDALADSIFSFSEKIEQYDVALLYYAGHGFQADGDNILAPIDLNTNTRPQLIRRNAFTLSELMQQLNQYPEQTKIVILDACREQLGGRGGFKDFGPVSAPPGSIIAFSTSPGQSSKENSATGHGYYTEALLDYIALPRVPIETVFKKVRESLVAATNGTQIPWEHTSLIGDFYLNPRTIYDGASYSEDAEHDAHFHFTDESVKQVVGGLKKLTWPIQREAIEKVDSIDFSNSTSDELFVLGRNIYQAACGSCYAVQRFIKSFDRNGNIPEQAQLHILNGMAYEIYFNSEGQLRKNLKTEYYGDIIQLLEEPQFSGSCEFIASKLCAVEDRLLYIPGKNEVMDLIVSIVEEEESLTLENIVYEGRPVLYSSQQDTFSYEDVYAIEIKKSVFEARVAAQIVAPIDCIRFSYKGFDPKTQNTFLIPADGFSLRTAPYDFDF